MDAKRLRHLIELGHTVELKDSHGVNFSFFFCDVDGDFLSKEMYKDFHTPEEIEELFTDEYEIITPAPKLLQPGDRCVILENVRELAGKEGWGICAKQSIGNTIFVVDRVCSGSYDLVEYENGNVFGEIDSVPHRAVEPYYEKEIEKNTDEHQGSLSTGKEISVDIDGKKVKAKILSIEE